MPLAYARASGAVTLTLGELADQPPGTVEETFHFALNNAVVADDRIPPYAMSRDVAAERNALPVPATLYGNPAPGGVYRYWDELTLSPPAGAQSASIRLLYQPTSWEYVRFLADANEEESAFLGEEGEHFLAAWLATGMAEPFVMAESTWGTPLDPTAIFGDDFENGNTCGWSERSGSADTCPP